MLYFKNCEQIHTLADCTCNWDEEDGRPSSSPYDHDYDNRSTNVKSHNGHKYY